MKIVVFEKLSGDWLSYRQESGEWPNVEGEGFCVNPFITAALLISKLLGFIKEPSGEELFNEAVRPILKIVSYFAGYYQDKLFVPFAGLGNCKFEVGVEAGEAVVSELEERFERMKGFRVEEFGVVESYEDPDFLLVNCLDYYPMEGVGEALYAGFFVEGMERWNFYFGPRGQVPRRQALEAAKGIVVTGSRHCSYAQDGTWKESLMEIFPEFINRGRIVGICFGHQLIARAFKGETSRNPSNKYIYRPETISGPTTYRIMESHGDCVSLIPPGFQCEFSSSSCQVESLRLFDKVLTFQGHPEYTEEFLKKFHLRTMKIRRQVPDQDLEKVENLAPGSLDSLEVISQINSFLRDGVLGYTIGLGKAKI